MTAPRTGGSTLADPVVDGEELWNFNFQTLDEAVKLRKNVAVG